MDEISDDEWGAVIAGMGSPKASLTRVRANSPRYALELLEDACRIKSSFVIPFEIGAGNSLNPMLAAVQRKIPVVDGDPVGRAVPDVYRLFVDILSAIGYSKGFVPIEEAAG